MTQMPSPCVNICSLDQSGKYCLGCGRSLNELADWQNASEAERGDIMAQLPERLRALKARERSMKS
jgi:predicted Fe-S protein YdhL (DUF1289 family)